MTFTTIDTKYVCFEFVCAWDQDGMNLLQIAFIPVRHKDNPKNVGLLFTFFLLGLGINIIFKV